MFSPKTMLAEKGYHFPFIPVPSCQPLAVGAAQRSQAKHRDNDNMNDDDGGDETDNNDDNDYDNYEPTINDNSNDSDSPAQPSIMIPASGRRCRPAQPSAVA